MINITKDESFSTKVIENDVEKPMQVDEAKLRLQYSVATSWSRTVKQQNTGHTLWFKSWLIKKTECSKMNYP